MIFLLEFVISRTTFVNGSFDLSQNLRSLFTKTREMTAYGGLHCPDILTKHYGQIHKRSNKLRLSGQTDRIHHTDKHTEGTTNINGQTD